MNIYMVVEGEVGEKKLYEKWVPYNNPKLTYCPTIDQVDINNFYIAIGGGYPNIFEIVRDAIEDISSIKDNDDALVFNRLVVALDSEEDTFQAKYNEIKQYIDSILLPRNLHIDYKIIIQHFCLETWGLANKKLITNNIHSVELLKYKKLFDVGLLDPELLPSVPDEDLSRIQFASKYLRLLLNNKFRNLSYSKNNPSALLHINYFEQVKNRHLNDKHIPSFDTFLKAFV